MQAMTIGTLLARLDKNEREEADMNLQGAKDDWEGPLGCSWFFTLWRVITRLTVITPDKCFSGCLRVDHWVHDTLVRHPFFMCPSVVNVVSMPFPMHS